MKILSLPDSRARRLVSAGLSGIAGRLATLVAPLLATPAMLHYLGDKDYGLWATGVSITSIAVIADLGIANGLLTRVAAAYGRSDFTEIRKYVSAAYAALATIAGLILCLSLIGFWFFHGSEIILSVLAAFLIGMPGAVFYQFLYGIQRVPVGNAIVVLGAAAAVVACLTAIHFDAPNWIVVICYGLPSALASYGGAVWFFWAHPQFKPRIADIEWPFSRDLLKLGSGFFVLSILTGVGMNIDNIVISTVAGAETVAAYSIPVRLGSILGLLTTALFMPLWGANGEALAKQDYSWVRRTALSMSVLGILLTAAGGSVLVPASDAIIQLWVGRSFHGQSLVLAAVVLSYTVVAATSPYNMVLNALGRVRVQIWPWLVFLIVSLPLKIMFVSPDGLWHIPLITGIIYALTVCPVVSLTVFRTLRRLELSKPIRAK